MSGDNAVAKEVAKAKYFIKVCRYLGVDPKSYEEVLERVFGKLYINMKRAFNLLSEAQDRLVDEDEVRILMAREIVEDICEDIPIEHRGKCFSILHKILTRGTGFEELLKLPKEVKDIIKEGLKNMGASLSNG